MSSRSPPLCQVCAARSLGLANRLIWARETGLNLLPLWLHYQENQGHSDARPGPQEQGALGKRPGSTYRSAPNMPSTFPT